MITLELTWERIYCICIFFWSFLFTVINESLVSLPTEIYSYTWLAIRLVLILKILTVDSRNRRDFMVAVAILVLGLISTHYSGSSFLEAFFWFLAAANQIDVKKIVVSLFRAQLLAFILIIGLSLMGVIESNDIVREGTGQLRRSFGFSHPNSFAQKAFQLILMSVYLLYDRIRIRHVIILVSVNYIVYRYSDSNTLWYMTILLASLLMLYIISTNRIMLLSNLSTWAMRLLKYICVIVSAASVYITLNYGSLEFVSSVDSSSTLLSRFSQMYLYFESYDINLFGQELYYHSSSNNAISYISGLYTLDNSYLYLLLGFGIIIFMFIIILFILTMRKAVQNGDYIILILMAIYLVYGFTETCLIRFSYNFTLVFLFPSIWKYMTSTGYENDMADDS